jgi:hypothetical protein
LRLPNSREAMRVTTIATGAGQPSTPFRTTIRAPPNPTELPIDRSNSPTAREIINPRVAIRTTVCVPKISLAVEKVANVVGMSAEKKMMTATQAKSTP